MNLPSWLNAKDHSHIDFGLDRISELLKRLGDPQKKLPFIIHIAGTNGKGSTLSFLKSIFTESGYLVHAYTSPHLVKFNERIVLAGKEISDDFLNDVLNECKKTSEKFPKIDLTFFEITTAAAFLAFSKVKADIVLLEVGMGGRLDATNVVEEVGAFIITPISLDHTDFLGKTISKIAAEKAAITKKNSLGIIGKQKSEALRIIENTGRKMNANLIFFAREWKIKKQKNGFLFEGFGKKIAIPSPSLEGNHQLENASVAIACALSLEKKFPNLAVEKNIKSGIAKTKWRARLQKIEEGKFIKNAPKNFEIYLDGSHNLQGAGTVLEFLKTKKDKKIFVIFSMLKDKDCENFLKKISSKVKIEKLFALEIAGESRSCSSLEIQKIAEKCNIKSGGAENFSGAFTEIFKNHKSGEDALILICGSLYLAGKLLEENEIL